MSVTRKRFSDLGEQLAEQLDSLFVISGEVVELHAVLEHALVLGIGRHHLDDLKNQGRAV